MCELCELCKNICYYLTHCTNYIDNLIKINGTKLDTLGDVSFSLEMKYWFHLLDCNLMTRKSEKLNTIFDFLWENVSLDEQIKQLILKSQSWNIPIDHYKINEKKKLVYLYLKKTNVFYTTIKTVLNLKNKYGSNCFKYNKKINTSIENESLSTLTELRMSIIYKTVTNLVKFVSQNNDINCTGTLQIKIVNDQSENHRTLMVGPVLNEFGVKDRKTTPQELYEKRKKDLQLVAQHRYGLQVLSSNAWKEYINNLGVKSVNIECLINKPCKSLKITLHDVTMANKYATFIFYNCARIEKLLNKFYELQNSNVYPKLLPLEQVDFNLLNQKEEWILIYVYIMNFPLLIKDVFCDIKNSYVSPHLLVRGLGNLVSVFSVYYRKTKILIEPREHLMGTLCARIYLLQALRQVFHTILLLIDIEPIKEM